MLLLYGGKLLKMFFIFRGSNRTKISEFLLWYLCVHKNEILFPFIQTIKKIGSALLWTEGIFFLADGKVNLICCDNSVSSLRKF